MSITGEKELTDNIHDSSKIERNLKGFEYQVSGHKFRQGKSGKKVPALIDTEDGCILKALQDPPRGLKELEFYQEIWQGSNNDPELQMFTPFIPSFYGKVEKEEGNFLKLSNLTRGCCKPCVMDIKMGRISYDQKASPEKIDKEIKKYPPREKLGFMISGILVYNSETCEYKQYDKHYARTLTEDTIVSDGLGQFFNLLDHVTRRQMLQSFLAKLQQLETLFSQQQKFSFIASSLLVVYDGLPPSDTKIFSSQSDTLGMHLIDFSHVFPSNSIDQNVLYGIQKLISCVTTMLT